jgi:hypothetical protein
MIKERIIGTVEVIEHVETQDEDGPIIKAGTVVSRHVEYRVRSDAPMGVSPELAAHLVLIGHAATEAALAGPGAYIDCKKLGDGLQ